MTVFLFYSLYLNLWIDSSLYPTPLSVLGQALGLLVSLSLIHYCTYTFDLSTM